MKQYIFKALYGRLLELWFDHLEAASKDIISWQ